MVEEGLCLISEKKYQEAAERFGEAMVNDDTNAWYFMLRAWALNDFMKQSNAAVAVYKRVLDLEYPENDVRSFRGFAALFAGDRKRVMHGLSLFSLNLTTTAYSTIMEHAIMRRPEIRTMLSGVWRNPLHTAMPTHMTGNLIPMPV